MEGKIICNFKEVWKAKVPTSVRIFGYLLLKQKLLTRDMLNTRPRGRLRSDLRILLQTNSGMRTGTEPVKVQFGI